jgi:hypothetical protein
MVYTLGLYKSALLTAFANHQRNGWHVTLARCLPTERGKIAAQDQSASCRKTLLQRAGFAQVLGVLDQHAASTDPYYTPNLAAFIELIECRRTGIRHFQPSFPGCTVTSWGLYNRITAGETSSYSSSLTAFTVSSATGGM